MFCCSCSKVVSWFAFFVAIVPLATNYLEGPRILSTAWELNGHIVVPQNPPAMLDLVRAF